MGRKKAIRATAAPGRPDTMAPIEATIIMLGPGASWPRL
jgi:hypothetical protein